GLRQQRPIIAADLLYSKQEMDVLQRVPQQRDEGEFPQDEERGQHCGDDRSQRNSGLRRESECDQRGRYASQVDRATTHHLADHSAAGRLQHEVLGDQGADEELFTSVLVHGRCSCHQRRALIAAYGPGYRTPSEHVRQDVAAHSAVLSPQRPSPVRVTATEPNAPRTAVRTVSRADSPASAWDNDRTATAPGRDDGVAGSGPCTNGGTSGSTPSSSATRAASSLT